MITRHHIPSEMPKQLDLRFPPAKKAAAVGYGELLRLLEELGARLDQGEVSRSELRSWEHAVVQHLHDQEIDQFMRVADETELKTAALPDQRWRNLRSILLARKGLSPRIC